MLLRSSTTLIPLFSFARNARSALIVGATSESHMPSLSFMNALLNGFLEVRSEGEIKLRGGEVLQVEGVGDVELEEESEEDDPHTVAHSRQEVLHVEVAAGVPEGPPDGNGLRCEG